MPAIDVHQRSALRARKDRPVDVLGVGLLAEDQAAARAAERLVRGGRDVIGQGHRVVVQARGHQPGVMRHVDKQLRTAVPGDFGEGGVRHFPRIGAGPGDDHLRLVFPRQRGDLVDVDAMGVRPHPVGEEMIQLAGDVQLHAVGEVPAVGQVQAEHHVARLERREVDGRVGLGAGVRLHVDVLGVEQLLGAIAGEFLDLIDELAAAVIPLARIPSAYLFVSTLPTAGMTAGLV